MRHARSIRRKGTGRAHPKREGIVVLVVMLVLFMATGTAVFAIQSSQYEQRASASLGESNWARGLAECTAMAGIAFAENPTLKGPGLGAQWMEGGGTGAHYAQKYAIPAPRSGNLVATTNAIDSSSSVQLMDAPVAAPLIITSNAASPNGLVAFLPASDRRRDSPNYPLFADYDSQTMVISGRRFIRAHWLQETLRTEQGGTEGPHSTVVSGRERTVVTAFAEVNVWNDPLDSSNVRGLHELDAVARGYIDTLSFSR